MSYRLIAWKPDRSGTDPQRFTDLHEARAEGLELARQTGGNVTVARTVSHTEPDRVVIYCTPEGRVYPS